VQHSRMPDLLCKCAGYVTAQLGFEKLLRLSLSLPSTGAAISLSTTHIMASVSKFLMILAAEVGLELVRMCLVSNSQGHLVLDSKKRRGEDSLMIDPVMGQKSCTSCERRQARYGLLL